MASTLNMIDNGATLSLSASIMMFWLIVGFLLIRLGLGNFRSGDALTQLTFIVILCIGICICFQTLVKMFGASMSLAGGRSPKTDLDL
jgi:hypothetical protein